MKNIRQFIREIIPVIIGILIALVINNWNEDRKDKQYLNRVFVAIEQELEDSHAEISVILPKQQALLDSIAIHLDNEQLSLFDLVLRSNGIQKPEVKMNAWKTIVSTKIELIDYEKLAALSDIDERRENIDHRVEKMMDFLLVNIAETSREKKELLRIMTIDVMNAETRLQERIGEMIGRENDSTDD
ncbi:MAG: DUF6090 family protein [Bacteroidota bacterium]